MTRLITARAALVVAASAGLAGLLSGCSAGQITQTDTKVPAVPGANAQVNDLVALRDLTVRYAEKPYVKGCAAPLEVRIFTLTQEPVALTGASSPDGTVVLVKPPATSAPASASASASPSAAGTPSASASAGGSSPSASPSATGGASAPANCPVRPGTGTTSTAVDVKPDGGAILVPGGKDGYLEVQNLTRERLGVGDWIDVTFTFTGGKSATVRVPVGLPSTIPSRTAKVEASSPE